MEKIEDYLLKLYNPTKNKRLYHKIYYVKHRKKIIDYNLNRYNERLFKGDFKLTKKEFIIKFN
jgi:hypothetical protein